jgi:predicted Zn-dependent protease
LDLPQVKEVYRRSLHSKIIKDEEFKQELAKVRESDSLPYGLVFLVGKTNVDKIETFNSDQPGIFGVGDFDGYVILRCTHQEAVRHELGHMLGLNHHDPYKPECIMNYKCPVPDFCIECKNITASLWKYQ